MKLNSTDNSNYPGVFIIIYDYYIHGLLYTVINVIIHSYIYKITYLKFNR